MAARPPIDRAGWEPRVTEGPSTDKEDGDTLPPGTPLLQGQFLIDGFLNAGGFGITYLARDSLERRIVVKECFPASMCCRAARTVSGASGK